MIGSDVSLPREQTGSLHNSSRIEDNLFSGKLNEKQQKKKKEMFEWNQAKQEEKQVMADKKKMTRKRIPTAETVEGEGKNCCKLNRRECNLIIIILVVIVIVLVIIMIVDDEAN